MPIRTSSPKAVRAAVKAVAAAGITAAVVAAPATAHAMVPPPGAYLAANQQFSPGESDAAQRQATPPAGPGLSDAAQRTRAEFSGPYRTSYQPTPRTTGYGAHMTPMSISSATPLPSAHVMANMAPAKDLGITLSKPAVAVVADAGPGFDVSSAAIGAGGAAVLVVLAIGGTLAFAPRRGVVRAT